MTAERGLLLSLLRQLRLEMSKRIDDAYTRLETQVALQSHNLDRALIRHVRKLFEEFED